MLLLYDKATFSEIDYNLLNAIILETVVLFFCYTLYVS